MIFFYWACRQNDGARISLRVLAAHVSKSHVHDISSGRRGVSATRTAAATENLSRERFAIIEGQVRAVDPISRRDRQKRRYMRAIQDARRSGDFRELRATKCTSRLVLSFEQVNV
jgi:hypothetical protein